MHIYFVGTTIALRGLKAEYKAIIKILENEGHKVLADHLFKEPNIDSVSEMVSEFDEESSVDFDNEEGSGTGQMKFFEKIASQIGKADMVVVEASIPTRNLAYEVEYALEHGKSVLVLYCADKKKPDAYIVEDDANWSSLLLVKEYTSESLPSVVVENVRAIVKSKEEVVCVALDSRLRKYLSWITEKKGMSSASYLKGLLEEKMRRDEVYKG